MGRDIDAVVNTWSIMEVVPGSAADYTVDT